MVPSAGSPSLLLILALAALVSFSLAGVAVEDGFHPLALVATLLLLSRLPGPRPAARRPASAPGPPAAGTALGVPR